MRILRILFVLVASVTTPASWGQAFCQWYAAIDQNNYLRASDACSGYFFGGGRAYYSPSYNRFDYASLYYADQPASGAGCWFGGDPPTTTQNIFGASIRAWPCVDAGICNPYPANSTYGCGKTISDLRAVQKSTTDPTRLFHATQTCIAEEACARRCTMDNCKWIDRVLPDFVAPYLSKQGQWTTIETQCQARGTGWLSDRLCAEAMARNHIFTDLLPSLIRSGCGSESDWVTVKSAIESCSSQSFTTTVERAASSMVVVLYREIVRSQCTSGRSSQGLPANINSDLQGKVCQQQ